MVKARKCRDGQLKIFTTMKVVFEKGDLIHACMIHNSRIIGGYKPIKGRNNILKIAKEYYNYYGRYATVSEHFDESEYDQFFPEANKNVKEFFPELFVDKIDVTPMDDKGAWKGSS